MFNLPTGQGSGAAFESGLKTGTSIYDLLMKRRLAAEQLKEQKRVHDEQVKQHNELMKIRLAAAARNAELQPYKIREYEARIKGHDPAAKYRALQEFITGLDQENNGNNLVQPQGFEEAPEETIQQSFVPAFNDNEQPFSTPELVGETAVSPYEVSQYEAQQANKPKTVAQRTGILPKGISLKELVTRGLLKKELGVDIGKEDVLHGPARDSEDLEKLKNKYGEKSEIYQRARAKYIAQQDAQQDLRDLRARTKSGLKPGEKEFFDEKTGSPLGKEIPLTAAERASEEGASMFTELYPYVYNGAAPFSGEGSISRLEEAAANYKTNPAARKAFDDFLLAEKMMAATLVNESATLKAGKTNRTYGILKESLEAQDVPKKVKSLIKQYQIPASAQLTAAKRYQDILSRARKNAKKSVPATQKFYYNPELQAKNEAQRAEGSVSNVSETKIINGVKYEKIDGEWYESE